MASKARRHTHAENGGKVIELPRGKRATSYDVARLAGVSQSAVSRCYKPGASVSAKMRARVMEAARQLEYHPNAIARGLITQRSNLVAVLISGRVNLYYPEVLFRLTEHLSGKGLRALLFTIDSLADADQMLDHVWQYQVDGVISASHLTVAQCITLEKRGIPVILFNRYFDNHSTNSIWCDTRRQTAELIGRLYDYGHRNFGIVRGPDINMVGRERIRGVLEELHIRGMSPTADAKGDFTYESGSAAMQLFVQGGAQAPTAVICANDMMALGCIDEARGVLGLAVPDDISIAGFDGIGVAQFASYELTTIGQPIDRMAESAVAMLLERLDQPDQSNEHRVFEGRLIDGASIGPCPVIRAAG